MNIEAGDYFVITRGRKLSRRNSSTFAFLAGHEGYEREPEYDHCYEGYVFLALEVCDKLVACEVVFPLTEDGYNPKASLHTDELEIMTVSKAYVGHLIKSNTPAM